MRYLVAKNEQFEGSRYSFLYDTKYKRFVSVHRLFDDGTYEAVEYATPNFYVFFPGFARQLRAVENERQYRPTSFVVEGRDNRSQRNYSLTQK